MLFVTPNRGFLSDGGLEVRVAVGEQPMPGRPLDINLAVKKLRGHSPRDAPARWAVAARHWVAA
jgi:hypothetical protein